MSFAEITLLCILIGFILVLAQVRAALNSLARIHDDLRILCTVTQESPQERLEREKEGWEYSGTPNLIRQKCTRSGVPRGGKK
jgi:hypothetical protein